MTEADCLFYPYGFDTRSPLLPLRNIQQLAFLHRRFVQSIVIQDVPGIQTVTNGDLLQRFFLLDDAHSDFAEFIVLRFAQEQLLPLDLFLDRGRPGVVQRLLLLLTDLLGRFAQRLLAAAGLQQRAEADIALCLLAARRECDLDLLLLPRFLLLLLFRRFFRDRRLKLLLGPAGFGLARKESFFGYLDLRVFGTVDRSPEAEYCGSAIHGCARTGCSS